MQIWRGRWASFEEGSLGTCHENVFFVHVFFLVPAQESNQPNSKGWHPKAVQALGGIPYLGGGLTCFFIINPDPWANDPS